MVENLEQVYLMGRKFEFVHKIQGRLIYKFEDRELGQFSILELIFSENEKKIKKIDIYNFDNAEQLETIHIIRGDDDITELDYYQNEYELITIDKDSKLYNVSIHLLYSEVEKKFYQETLELIKKGHKKHKTLYQIPNEENYYITKDKKMHYVSAGSVDKITDMAKTLFPSILEIENNLFECQDSNTCEDDSTEKVIEDISDIYPTEIYIYDRYYYLLGKKGEAITYQNNEFELYELEIYLNDDKTRVKEVRLIEYINTTLEGIETKSKKQIIRFKPLNDNKVLATLCNRKKESALLDGKSIDKGTITARAIVNDNFKLEKLEVKIQNQLGTLNLSNIPDNKTEYADKNGEIYTISSVSFKLFKMFSVYTPGIIRRLERLLIKEKQQPTQLNKKY